MLKLSEPIKKAWKNIHNILIKRKKITGQIELDKKLLIHIIFFSKGGNSNIAIVYKRLRMCGKITCKFVI